MRKIVLEIFEGEKNKRKILAIKETTTGSWSNLEKVGLFELLKQKAIAEIKKVFGISKGKS